MRRGALYISPALCTGLIYNLPSVGKTYQSILIDRYNYVMYIVNIFLGPPIGNRHCNVLHNYLG